MLVVRKIIAVVKVEMGEQCFSIYSNLIKFYFYDRKYSSDEGLLLSC